ncbi:MULTISPECIES: bacillithiol biosynthesis cysteine-adding enzyme BshC [Sporosarcina]|uniref:bacillithiol biosynthesis cysteine-adding enzyme BshC n=1 Tax=Sporosarcina TaxID=1569 RepID=UPI001891BC30|nr:MULTISPECIES: bacillithiol biosynthesis cysteine-adding enzyme BshC [Sporosarcina]GKV64287.1 putative cysteine ligase BshC [Sporosarcina sp. NCCP-2331]GLB54249.1 putative cysteine ligase BshC [Sporosarcina sp. NCCP-2378]
MELDTIELPGKNKLMEAYRQDSQFNHRFFDYEITAAGYEERAKELTQRAYQREELAALIESYMKPYGISELAAQHIKELSLDALVVIGGQQAGVLTGPLYSVHKAISVILLAREQRDVLEKPVVPVFWIAGEDHDINEINHTYTAQDGKAVKRQFKQSSILKSMASDTVYDQKEMHAYIKKIFKSYGESAYTNKLLQNVLKTAEEQQSYTGFFTALMNQLFSDHGLLFLDAAYKPLRQLESAYFSQMIENAADMAASIYSTEQDLNSLGYDKPIESEEQDANLFYVHDTGRVLLKRNGEMFVNEQIGLSFSQQEMHELAEKEPWLLSNNVATRPLMQDLVFPVLAFVGGPGEIAYWSLLKESFHKLGIRMPVIVPRISITLISRQVQEALKMSDVTIRQVLDHQLPQLQKQWLDEQKDETFDALIDESREQLHAQFEKMQAHLKEQDQGLLQVLDKNLQFHEKQFSYLKKMKEQSLLRKHQVQYRRYQILSEQLYPEGSLQERLYSPYFFINQFGEGFIDELLRQPYCFDGKHQLVYL